MVDLNTSATEHFSRERWRPRRKKRKQCCHSFLTTALIILEAFLRRKLWQDVSEVQGRAEYWLYRFTLPSLQSRHARALV
eukprot:1377945-Pleurochrysis_carterae.AAC.1